MSTEYASTLESINSAINLGPEELEMGNHLDTLMAKSIDEHAKATTPLPKKRQERHILDEKEWNKELGEEEEKLKQRTRHRRRLVNSNPTAAASRPRRRTNMKKKPKYNTLSSTEDEEEEEEKEKEVKEVKSQQLQELNYQVEEILDEAYDVEKQQMLYLVKWAHYSHKYNTWEPLTNLTNCVEALNAYLVAQYHNNKK